MTRYYNYTFKHYLSEITISKAVTDNMEDRDRLKAGYAAEFFNNFLRTHAGHKHSTVTAAKIKEVTKSETVSMKVTLQATEKAYDQFITELENGTFRA